MSRITYRWLTVSDFAHILWNFTGKGDESHTSSQGLGAVLRKPILRRFGCREVFGATGAVQAVRKSRKSFLGHLGAASQCDGDGNGTAARASITTVVGSGGEPEGEYALGLPKMED